MHSQGNAAKGSRRVFDPDGSAVAQPAARRGKEETERFGPAIIIDVPVLHQRVTEHREKVRVGRAVRRAVEDAPARIRWPEGKALPAHERVARESLGQHAVEADQRPLRLVAAQQVQRVTRAIERIEPMAAGARSIRFWSTGTMPSDRTGEPCR